MISLTAKINTAGVKAYFRFYQQLGMNISELPEDTQRALVGEILTMSKGEKQADLLALAATARSAFVPDELKAAMANEVARRKTEKDENVKAAAASAAMKADPEVQALNAELQAAKRAAKLAEVRHASFMATAREKRKGGYAARRAVPAVGAGILPASSNPRPASTSAPMTPPNGNTGGSNG